MYPCGEEAEQVALHMRSLSALGSRPKVRFEKEKIINTKNNQIENGHIVALHARRSID
jgi:hypothetical protein